MRKKNSAGKLAVNGAKGGLCWRGKVLEGVLKLVKPRGTSENEVGSGDQIEYQMKEARGRAALPFENDCSVRVPRGGALPHARPDG